MYLGCRMICQTVVSYRSPTTLMEDRALIGRPRLRIVFDLSHSNCLAAANHQLSEIQPKQRQSPPTATLMLRDTLYILACKYPFDPLGRFGAQALRHGWVESDGTFQCTRAAAAPPAERPKTVAVNRPFPD